MLIPPVAIDLTRPTHGKPVHYKQSGPASRCYSSPTAHSIRMYHRYKVPVAPKLMLAVYHTHIKAGVYSPVGPGRERWPPPCLNSVHSTTIPRLETAESNYV